MDVSFDKGTLLLRRPEDDALPGGVEGLHWDPRVAAWRAPAHLYPRLVSQLRAQGWRGRDRVRAGCATRVAYQRPDLRPYQLGALDAWHVAGQRGVVVLPTGSGKTRVALAAMASVGRAALVLVPTRALLGQWVERVRQLGPVRVGVFGDGRHEVEDVTICTFESAVRNMDAFGDRFGLLVVDEVHHFASGARAEALEMCPAPARLGLTATPPRACGELATLARLVGPVVYERSVAQFVGEHLAPLEHVMMRVQLTDAERRVYDETYEPFRQAVRAFMVSWPGREYGDFVKAASASERGREILHGHRAAQELVAGCQAKREVAARLLARHRDERVLLFTASNQLAYRLSGELLLPAVTCDVKAKERESVLARFRQGRVRGIVSSRVLNEGLDVPDAGVAIVLGGKQGAREHVQRIGRVLRPGPGKVAVVYEVVAADTYEAKHAQRRAAGLWGRGGRAAG